MSKKKIANLIMIALVVVITSAGILGTGYLKGWFDQKGSSAIISNIRGTCTLTREGVAYVPDKNTVLRVNDSLTTGYGTTLEISVEDGSLILGENATVTVKNGERNNFVLDVNEGEMFVSASADFPISVNFDKRKIVFRDSSAIMSILRGSSNVNVLSGTIKCEKTASAGQTLNWVGNNCSRGTLQLASLNDFGIDRIREANKVKPMCFTNEQLDQLEADRLAAIEEMINDEDPIDLDDSHQGGESSREETQQSPGKKPTDSESSKNPQNPENPEKNPTESKPVVPGHSESRPSGSHSSGSQPSESKPVKPAPEASESSKPDPVKPKPPVHTMSCYLTIRCDKILQNMDELNPEKVKFVPNDGIILHTVEVKFEAGDSVFDILKRVCNKLNIQIEYSWSPVYDSHYIEGINHLYEFDCGSESGWMYKVNGWYPNYGCTQYFPRNGDVIEWDYTCNGLGGDLGAPVE